MTDVADTPPAFYVDASASTETDECEGSIYTNASGEISDPVIYVADEEGGAITLSISSQTDAGSGNVSLFSMFSYDDSEEATNAYKLSVLYFLLTGV